MTAWPEGIAFAPNGRAWIFPDAHVIFTQSTSNEPTLADVNGLFDFFAWLEHGVDALPPGKPPTVIHDWRSFERIPPDVRSLFAKRRREIKTVPERLLVALGVSPVLRMAIRTVALGAQLLTRAVPLELVDDPRPELIARGVDAPDALLHLRLRKSWAAR